MMKNAFVQYQLLNLSYICLFYSFYSTFCSDKIQYMFSIICGHDFVNANVTVEITELYSYNSISIIGQNELDQHYILQSMVLNRLRR